LVFVRLQNVIILYYPTAKAATDGGNQQFTAQRLKFNGCKNGVQLIWDWGWVHI